MSFSIIGMGEVLWDLLPAGPQLGGAPANFAYQAQGLGAYAMIISRVGNDRLGEDIVSRFQSLALSTDQLQIDDQYPTGTVAISLSEKGVPDYHFPEQVAWDHIEANAKALDAMHYADAVCFGTLGQRHPQSRAAIQQLVAAAPQQSLRIFDINLRQNFYNQTIIRQSLKIANVLKLNDEELAILQSLLGLPADIREQVKALATTFQLTTVVLTCGSQGSLIYHNGVWSEMQPQRLSQIADTVGVGDAFTAALAMGLLAGDALKDVHAQAEEQARIVCQRAGGIDSP